MQPKRRQLGVIVAAAPAHLKQDLDAAATWGLQVKHSPAFMRVRTGIHVRTSIHLCVCVYVQAFTCVYACTYKHSPVCMVYTRA